MCSGSGAWVHDSKYRVASTGCLARCHLRRVIAPTANDRLLDPTSATGLQCDRPIGAGRNHPDRLMLVLSEHVHRSDDFRTVVVHVP